MLARELTSATVRAKTDLYAQNIYGAELSDPDRAVHAAVQKVASARGVPAAQVALAWVCQKPGIVSPIVGASKLNHIEDALAALTLNLSADEMKALEEHYVPHPIAGHS